MRTNLLSLCALTILFLSSCTEAYKHKQEIAKKHLEEMNAASVSCGVSAETHNGESMSMTTFTFNQCSSDIEDIEREWAANLVAKELSEELSAKDLEGETHMKLVASTKSGEDFTYLFDLKELKLTEEYMEVADAAIDACILDNQATINDMVDDAMMPAEAMSDIFQVTHYNDSIYDDQALTTITMGYRFTTSTDDDELELFSVDYDVEGDVAHTMYTINVDMKTKKIAGIWLKTDPY